MSDQTRSRSEDGPRPARIGRRAFSARRNDGGPESKDAVRPAPTGPALGHDFSRVQVGQAAPLTVQAKLKISHPGDRDEREADRVAEQVLRKPEPPVDHRPGVAREVSAGCPARRNMEGHVQSIRGGGRSLPESVRSEFERRFGHDFGQVRVHTDERAAQSAEAIQARAYTAGRDVVFARGQYAPQTMEGRRLLAHELTHVVQQANALHRSLAINEPGNHYERETDRAALAVSQHRLFPIARQAGVTLMRQSDAQKGSEKKEDPRVKELKEKVGALVEKKFDDDNKKAFDHYDADHDGGVDVAEIRKLLKDADYGNPVSRRVGAPHILKKMDTNKDGKVQWEEFSAAIE